MARPPCGFETPSPLFLCSSYHSAQQSHLPWGFVQAVPLALPEAHFLDFSGLCQCPQCPDLEWFILPAPMPPPLLSLTLSEVLVSTGLCVSHCSLLATGIKSAQCRGHICPSDCVVPNCVPENGLRWVVKTKVY